MTNHTAQTAPSIFDVIEARGGWVTRVANGPTSDTVTVHLTFRNVADKTHFRYALQTAWPMITFENVTGSARISVNVPLD